MLLDLQTPADAVSCGQNGLVELVLERRAGRTRLALCRTRPPLLVQQALYPDEAAPDMACVFLANPTGGLLQNDRHSITVSVGAGARSHVTTQSATKVYTMTEGVAEQRVQPQRRGRRVPGVHAGPVDTLPERQPGAGSQNRLRAGGHAALQRSGHAREGGHGRVFRCTGASPIGSRFEAREDGRSIWRLSTWSLVQATSTGLGVLWFRGSAGCR